MGRKKSNSAFKVEAATRDAKGNPISVTGSINTISRKSQEAPKDDSNYKKYKKTQPKPHVVQESTRSQSRPKSSNFNIEEIPGDLFDSSPDSALVHCVAEDMHMNAGIAIEFRKRFSSTGDLLDQKKKTGEVAIVEKKGRLVYYLVTKRKSQGKPLLSSVEQCLNKMSEHVENNNIKKIAMPTIGCGLDRLDWGDVRKSIENAFQHLDVHITVYLYNKTGSTERVKGSASQVKKEPLHKMDPKGTLFAYLAGEDSTYITDELQNFEQWRMIKKQEQLKTLTLGQVVRIKVLANEYAALVCLDKNGDIIYKQLENCMKELKKIDMPYMGIEILDKDSLEVKKLESVLRFSKEQKMEIWIYCPNCDDFYQ